MSSAYRETRMVRVVWAWVSFAARGARSAPPWHPEDRVEAVEPDARGEAPVEESPPEQGFQVIARGEGQTKTRRRSDRGWQGSGARGPAVLALRLRRFKQKGAPFVLDHCSEGL